MRQLHNYCHINMAERRSYSSGKSNKNVCHICLEGYIRPKFLKCHHTFCAGCIEGLISSNKDLGQFRCPLCYICIDIPADGKGAESFATNFYLHTDTTDDEDFSDHVCAIHKKQLALVCEDCDDILICLQCKMTEHKHHACKNTPEVI